MERECRRYGLDRREVEAVFQGEDPLAARTRGRRWWEFLIMAAALGVFVRLGLSARRQPLGLHTGPLLALSGATLAFLAVSAAWLWKRTRFN